MITQTLFLRPTILYRKRPRPLLLPLMLKEVILGAIERRESAEEAIMERSKEMLWLGEAMRRWR